MHIKKIIFYNQLIVFLKLIGVNPWALMSICRFPRYIKDRSKWLRMGGEISYTHPILIDYSDSAGVATGHYFHQDLLVASFIAKKNPERHIDIGSRIDGFIAHVASFRLIEVLDVRALPSTGHENIKFLQADLMNQDGRFPVVDSVSCLHAVEHFGLGRYTDRIDPKGYIKGFINLIQMVAPGGMLYISFPIGKKNEVHFNAHRVFHPQDIFAWEGCNELKLVRFDYVDDDGNIHQEINIFENLPDVKYGCGIYSFEKNKIDS